MSFTEVQVEAAARAGWTTIFPAAAWAGASEEEHEATRHLVHVILTAATEAQQEADQ